MRFPPTQIIQELSVSKIHKEQNLLFHFLDVGVVGALEVVRCESVRFLVGILINTLS